MAIRIFNNPASTNAQRLLGENNNRLAQSVERISSGIRINKDNKVLYCEKLKNVISNGQLILKDKRTISEARMFSRNSNGTYSAQSGNDDIMMTCVTTSSFFDTLDFSEIIEEYFDTLETTKQKRMDGLLDSDGNSDSLYDMFG